MDTWAGSVARHGVLMKAMRSHATRTMVNEPPFPVPHENLRQLPNDGIWKFETDNDFAAIGPTHFVGRIPGNSVVICVCADRNRTCILDRNGRIEQTIR